MSKEEITNKILRIIQQNEGITTADMCSILEIDILSLVPYLRELMSQEIVRQDTIETKWYLSKEGIK